MAITIPPISTLPLVSQNSNTQEAIRTPDTIALTEVNLQAGVSYVFLAAGHASNATQTLQNPAMGIFTSDFKTTLAAQDDSLGSVDPLIIFKAPATGTYGVAVLSSIPHGVGTYSLQIHPSLGPVTFGGSLGNIGAN